MPGAKPKSLFKTRRRRGSYLGVTGKFPSAKAEHSLFFESLRERDLFVLLSFDQTVERVDDHPLTIEYHDGKRQRRYSPDALVTHRPAGDASVRRRLIEVKMSDQLERQAEELKAPFHAATAYASAHDMTFEVVTELQLPRPRVSNLRFLYPYRLLPEDLGISGAILGAINRPMSLDELFSKIADMGFPMASVIDQAWRLVARQEMAVELDSPLSLASRLEVRTWTVSL